MVALSTTARRLSTLTWRPAASLILPFILIIHALILSAVAAGSGVLPGDVALTRFVQSWPLSEFDWLFRLTNAAGSTNVATFITLGAALTLAFIRQPLAAALMLATLPLRASNAALKVFLESPRPNDDLVSVSEQAVGYGFPSGHVMGAVLLYGTLILLAPRIIARRRLRLGLQSAAVVMLALSGISRISVGAHWPSDVAGGYLWGTLLLLATFAAARGLPSLAGRLQRGTMRAGTAVRSANLARAADTLAD